MHAPHRMDPYRIDPPKMPEQPVSFLEFQKSIISQIAEALEIPPEELEKLDPQTVEEADNIRG